MTALLLEPHQDDAILWACFTILREQPEIVTVLADAQNQPGVTAEERDKENRNAGRVLGFAREVNRDLFWPWPYSDATPDWDAIRDDFEVLARIPEPGRGHLRTSEYGPYERVFAPWPEKGGHPQHNRIGELAGEVFGDRVTYYTTYRYGGPRTTGKPVEYEPAWIALKHRALACYTSQIERGPRRFFTWDLLEYTAP